MSGVSHREPLRLRDGILRTRVVIGWQGPTDRFHDCYLPIFQPSDSGLAQWLKRVHKGLCDSVGGRIIAGGAGAIFGNVAYKALEGGAKAAMAAAMSSPDPTEITTPVRVGVAFVVGAAGTAAGIGLCSFTSSASPTAAPTAAPPAPSRVVSSCSADGRTLTVEWRAASRVRSYEVKATGKASKEVVGTSTTFAVSPGDTYTAQVKSVITSGGNSGYSGWVSSNSVTFITTVPVPANVRAKCVTPSRNPNDPRTGVINVVVEWDTDPMFVTTDYSVKDLKRLFAFEWGGGVFGWGLSFGWGPRRFL